ncbi:MAG TPA: histidine ammonia-lyase [Clostridia bacterium]|nr:histidine ammonia-lyase [Clostridia bacterium]
MIELTGKTLTFEELIRVARRGERAAIAKRAHAPMDRARAYVEQKLDEGAAVYGLTTGFGKFSDTYISRADAEILQRKLIMSHACGMGEPLPEDAARAVMLLRANALCQGHSGIRRSTVEALLALLNAGVYPVIPEKGSLGASGDLAPLAHMALVLMGEGEAFYSGERLPGAEALRCAGLAPVVLAAKEGLALINGTQVMTAVGALAACDARELCLTADVACALTIEALLGITKAFDPRVHALRPHAGQGASAANLLRLLAGSSLAKDIQPGRVQDAYSLRCAPQVHGACRDAVDYVLSAAEIEMNSVTDNPLVFPDGEEAVSGGNFHGEPMALAFDFLGIAVSELADISERRTERLVNPALSNGLPAFLTRRGGLNSGFMIAQYAAASMVSENKVLAHPASVDSIPSSANQEDHVSMGTTAAKKAASILDNARKVLAIELAAACQALYLRGGEGLAPATRAVYDEVRKAVPPVEEDVIMYPYLNAAEALVKSGEVNAAVRRACPGLL